MSKLTPIRSRLTDAYWRTRLFRGSYTRHGRLQRVRGWRVKIQVRGRRRTFPLRSPGVAAAAREALALYRSLRGGDSVDRTVRTAPTENQGTSGGVASADRVRLVRRPHAPEGSGAPGWSVWLEQEGQGHYFPLGTDDPALAARQARRLQRELARVGMSGIQARHSWEATLSIRWCADPVMWTYVSLHTRPGPRPTPAIPPRADASRGLSIAVVEPDPGLRAALMECIAAGGIARCAAGFGGATEALEGMSRRAVDLLLVNQSLEGISGSDFLARLRLLEPRRASWVYSVCADSDDLFKSTPGGATGYLLRRTAAHRLLEPLDGAPFSGPPAPAALAERVRRYFQQLIGAPVMSGGSAEMSRLTARELEILGQMARGFLDKEIANGLRISVWTVHGHAKKIYEKLGVHSRTEAVVKYLQK